MKADDPSVPIITVRGNFTQGNISGQSAIGENITQIKTVMISPEGSTKNEHSWIYTQGAKPATDPNRIFGREEELEYIENLFKKQERSCHHWFLRKRQIYSGKYVR